MNKIILKENKIKNIKKDNSFNYEIEQNEILKLNILKIEILKNTDLELEYEFLEDSKYEVIINVKKNIDLNMIEKINGKNTKIRTKITLEDNAFVNISKINDIENIKENIIIYLNGINANINYNLKTICKNIENYDLIIYHNNKETKSEITTNGVNIQNGKLKFNVSSFVPNNNKNCIVTQNNRIINLTNNECIINPNLYIDEFEVSANHSANIGSFNKNEIFYLQSRGISKNEAIKLLIKGFLTNNLKINEEEKEEITKKIDYYWR